jgi:MYXO-CTERM domain-containing protein
VNQCPKIHVWIVGNEPNVGWSEDVELTTDANAAAYAAVHDAVHAVAGHAGDLVLLAPDSPYSPVCICSLHKAIQKVKAKGAAIDGFAVHAYTQAQHPSDYPTMASLVTSEEMSASNDGCGYPFHWQLRIYRDWIKAMEDEGEGGKPVFLSESGNACAPAVGNPCYPDADVGYFTALWGELNAWNATATTKIRAVTPYRWTKNDDGTGRDASIGTKPTLLVDLQKAFASKPAWTTPKTCGPSTGSCVTDDDCAGMSICDLATGKCAPTTPCPFEGSCGGGMICRAPDCVPESRGEATITVTPLAPRTAPVDVTLDAFDTVGLTNVEMQLESLSPSTTTVPTTWIGLKDPHFHWQWSAHLTAQGAYRATFRADPGRHVYAIGYFGVAFPGASDAGPDGGGADAGAGHDASTGDASGGRGDLTGGDDKGGCSCAVVGGGAVRREIALFSWVVVMLALARRRR